ncbi:hypothetical protein PybrP1_005555 [[Pythium] brassicae (nom. inval.)]|nr:hypothetical protein PybrP1_005555 [[Pythium] brassicae (nom. inval.)]
MPSAPALVTNQLAAAWNNWRQRARRSSADDELQFELVALGLVAALSAKQLQELFNGAYDTDGESGDVLALLLPLQPTFEQNPQRFHFAAVVFAKLAARALEETATPQAERWQRVVDELLLPIVRHQQFTRVHTVALETLKLIIQAHGVAMSELLAAKVTSILVDESSASTASGEQSVEDDASTSKSSEVSFGALCGVLQLLLESGAAVSPAVLDHTKLICVHSISRFEAAPQYLRAVSKLLIPSLLQVAPTTPRELTASVVAAWRAGDYKYSKSVANLMFLLCLLLPSDPELMADSGLQDLTAFALANSDALLRKQGMYLLNIAFSHYALDASSSDAETSSATAELETWQRFITASDVIQAHEQLHLIEQVWPHVTQLLESSLVVLKDASSATHPPATPSWPVKMSFDWVRSLLLRVFSHENPLVRRTFMATFMATCLQQWRAQSQSALLDVEASFMCSSSFHVFVFEHLMPSLNDPQMYRTSTKEAFQNVTREFLAAYLAFQLRNRGVRRGQLAGPEAAASLTTSYVEAVYAAIFGPDVSGHSPDALATMLEVFSDGALQAVARDRSAVSADDLLDEGAIDRLRITMEFRVMRSFPQSIRIKITRALVSALTGGFTDVATHSLHSIASIVLVLPLRIVVGDDGSTYLALHQWLQPERHRDEDGNGGRFLESLSTELSRYLSGQQGLEDEIAQVVELAASAHARFVFTFEPQAFYAAAEGSVLRTRKLFRAGLETTTQWISAVSGTPSGDVSPAATDSATNAKAEEDTVELLSATALVVTRAAIYAMEQDGDLSAINALDGVCDSLKRIMSPEKADCVDASAQTVAIRYLSVVASQESAVDAIQALESDSMLPLLLAARLNASTEGASKHYALCNVQYFVSRWKLMHSVLLGSSYVPAKLLNRVFTECLDALSAAGADPRVLSEMVQVLSLALAQLAAAVVQAPDRDEQLDALFAAVWGEYSECLAKPDVLTRAVVSCLFQPAFLLSEELCRGPDATLKRWVRRVFTFGEAHRPNVIFHLACRLAQVWRALPHSALWFVDEIVALLLFKEPVLDEREQLALAPGTVDTTKATAGGVAARSGLLVKDRLVRLVVLSFLDEMSVDSAAPDSSEHALLQQLLVQLLELNLAGEWTKPHMLHSEGFGKQLRCWQALCVLSKHVNSDSLGAVNERFWRTFAVPHLPALRHYLELFAMRLLLRFPRVTVAQCVVPLLADFNLTPQVGASLLLVAAYALHHRVDAPLASDHDLCALLVRAVLPWLHAAHGHTRILVQFLLATVLPRYLSQLEQPSSQSQEAPPTEGAVDVAFLRQTARFLSQNKEAKRMHRRQRQQLAKFRPESACSLLGVLSSAAVSDGLELLPSDDALAFGEQFKAAMAALFAQFQREHALLAPVAASPPSPLASRSAAGVGAGATPAALSLNVQRKIDRSAILLDESVLPVAMQERGEVVAALAARQSRRQPVILCASLVDKVPNLAGLARTCEVFNAQALVVPNRHVCDDEAFAAISATASKWVPIEQVQPGQGELVRALLAWKRDGYTVVALEQTAASVCLSSFVFPDKLVIVLGKEKEGVPVDVLQVVDVCVEIPQFGLIRSLNVHVSGAILLWEYTQQRLLRGE